MARAHERRQRWALWCYQRLLEGDAFVACQHGLTNPDQAIAVAHRPRDMRHLVATRLTLLDRPPEPIERLQKKGLDIVRLEPPRVGALHLFADAIDAACIHAVVRQGALFEEVLQVAAIHGIGDHLVEARPYLWPFAIADSLNE